MKNSLLLFGLCSLLLASCTQQRYAIGNSAYENDEVYLQSDDTYISDFALVDNEPEQNGQNNTPQDYVDPNTVDDDYYSDQQVESNQEDYYDDGSIINNYYGDVYQDQSGFGMNNSYGYYNNSWNNWGSNAMLIWNPYSGWRLRYNWGYGYGCYGGYYNNPWSWNTPWYDPWYGNSWCYNNWSSGYGYYDPWGWNSAYYGGYNNWYGNNYSNNYWNNSSGNNDNSNGGGGIVYGPRPSISVGSSVNSSYDNGTLVNHSAQKPGLVNGIDPTVSINNSKPLQKPTEHVSLINKFPTEEKETFSNGMQGIEPSVAPVAAVSPVNPSTDGKTHVNSSTSLDKPLEIERESTKPSAMVQPEKPTVAASKEDDYYTMPRPKPGATKPSYVSEKPSSSTGNSGTPSAKPSNSSSGSSGDNNSSSGYERESVKPSGANSSSQERKPDVKPQPSRTENKPSYTPPTPSKPEPRPQPSFTPSPSKPSGGSVSPGRSSSGNSSGGSSSGGRSGGGSSGGGSGRKK